MTEKLISKVNTPADIKGFTINELKQFACELREETISKVAKTGGHLGAGLGVVELTTALHYVFNTPKDQIIWDVSHQVYPHKILTGRKEQMHTIRKGGGLSGFAKRSESEYDPFGAGHGGTSISAALGMAVARDLNQDTNHVIAVIGDGSLSAGMAFEAMNNAGHLRSKMIVVLNDNEMSIAPNIGAMHKYLCRLTASKPYLRIRNMAKDILHHMPPSVEDFTKKAKKYTKDLMMGGNFFEEIGFHYIGPLDGHDLDMLVAILTSCRDDNTIESPILIHIKTQKGKGFNSPNSCGESYHAVTKFDLDTKILDKPKSNFPTYTKVFAQTLTELAKKDEKVVAITAAMPSGTGLNLFQDALPARMYDVGMCEQHAVTFAAGLACHGIKPFCTIYSTFLQRGYDQVVHDVALQNLPVRFAIDRAGVVGADGATHAGAYDLVYLCSLPNMVIMAASDEAELAQMVATSYALDDRPSAFRYPRGEGCGVAIPENPQPLEIGKAKVVKQGKRLAVISLGARLQEVMKAAQELIAVGLDITVVDARFAKPFDEELFTKIAQTHEALITIEEGAIGGFGSHVANFFATAGLLDNGLKFRSMFLPDYFMDHETQEKQYEEAGLDAKGIVKLAVSLCPPASQIKRVA
ncbi:MAG: 1-deoxy-D-xylulose-5-phosphate synthase [Rickettsiales bacterium]